MANQYVQVCDAINAGSCVGNITYESVYLLPPDSSTQLGLLLGGGFDIQAAEIGFLSVITLFAIGFTTGLIVNQIRKLRVHKL